MNPSKFISFVITETSTMECNSEKMKEAVKWLRNDILWNNSYGLIPGPLEIKKTHFYEPWEFFNNDFPFLLPTEKQKNMWKDFGTKQDEIYFEYACYFASIVGEFPDYVKQLYYARWKWAYEKFMMDSCFLCEKQQQEQCTGWDKFSDTYSPQIININN